MENWAELPSHRAACLYMLDLDGSFLRLGYHCSRWTQQPPSSTELLTATEKLQISVSGLFSLFNKAALSRTLQWKFHRCLRAERECHLKLSRPFSGEIYLSVLKSLAQLSVNKIEARNKSSWPLVKCKDVLRWKPVHTSSRLNHAVRELAYCRKTWKKNRNTAKNQQNYVNSWKK